MERLKKILTEMKENKNSFDVSLAVMKRKAEKGLLEYSIDDIENTLEEMNNEHKEKFSELSLNQDIFELSEAIEKFGYMENEEIQEPETNEVIITESKIPEINIDINSIKKLSEMTINEILTESPLVNII